MLHGCMALCMVCRLHSKSRDASRMGLMGPAEAAQPQQLDSIPGPNRTPGPSQTAFVFLMPDLTRFGGWIR